MNHLQQALDILDRMDDEITERGGDDDPHGRSQLSQIRRIKHHIRKADPSLDLRMNVNPRKEPR